MSIDIPVTANTSQVKAQLDQLTQQVNQQVQNVAGQAQQKVNAVQAQVAQTDNAIKKTEHNLFQMYVYTAHLSALIARAVERGMRGTEASVKAMAVLQGIQFVNSQIAAVNAGLQAKAAFASGNIPGGILLTAAAVMMEQNAIQLWQQQQETAKLTRSLGDIRSQMNSWD